MKIGVVIPSYNQGRYLGRAIESVCAQSVECRVVVCDAGSRDESVEIIKGYASRLDYWRSFPDAGQASAINEGIEVLVGCEYVTWLNSDDVLAPGALGVVALAARARRADIIYGNHETIDAMGSVVGVHYHPPWWRSLVSQVGPYIAQPGTFFRRDLWRSVGMLDEQLHCVMDTEFWLRCSQRGARFFHVNACLAQFRVHPESKGEKWKVRYRTEYEALKERYGLVLPAPAYRKIPYYIFKQMSRGVGA